MKIRSQLCRNQEAEEKAERNSEQIIPSIREVLVSFGISSTLQKGFAELIST
jgi:hypothetical protein